MTAQISGDAPASGQQPIEFTGNASDYFGIWITNMAFSFATLGIYSAWAKVKRVTYFNNNTKIAGHGLGYHATGKQILLGRLLAFSLLVLLSFAEYFSFYVQIVITVGFALLWPLFVNISLAFAAKMTSYRNVRFRWSGTYLYTFFYFFLAPIFAILSLGILAPLVSKHYYNYIANNYHYGTTGFSANPSVARFYKAYFIAVVLPGSVLFVGFVLFALGFIEQAIIQEEDIPFEGLGLLPTYLMLALMAIVFPAFYIYPVLCRNMLLRSTSLSDAVKFGSTMNPFMIIWIAFSNMLAVVFSLGFMRPWAQIRMYKYVANSSTFEITGDMNKFIDSATTSKSAFGEEFAGFQDLDMSI